MADDSYVFKYVNIHASFNRRKQDFGILYRIEIRLKTHTCSCLQRVAEKKSWKAWRKRSQTSSLLSFAFAKNRGPRISAKGKRSFVFGVTSWKRAAERDPFTSKGKFHMIWSLGGRVARGSSARRAKRWTRRKRREKGEHVGEIHTHICAHTVEGSSPASLRELLRGLDARGFLPKEKEFSGREQQKGLSPPPRACCTRWLQLSRASPGQSATRDLAKSRVRVNWVIHVRALMTRTAIFNSPAADHLRFSRESLTRASLRSDRTNVTGLASSSRDLSKFFSPLFLNLTRRRQIHLAEILI